MKVAVKIRSKPLNQINISIPVQTCVFFHEGRSGVGRSYVGRGITRLAALCLNHVAFEMANNHYSEVVVVVASVAVVVIFKWYLKMEMQ